MDNPLVVRELFISRELRARLNLNQAVDGLSSVTGTIRIIIDLRFNWATNVCFGQPK